MLQRSPGTKKHPETRLWAVRSADLTEAEAGSEVREGASGLARLILVFEKLPHLGLLDLDQDTRCDQTAQWGEGEAEWGRRKQSGGGGSRVGEHVPSCAC